MRTRCPRLLHESLRFAAADHPEKLAVLSEDARVTYAQLEDRASRLAAVLRARGVRRGDRVAILLENGVDAVAAIYGALTAGAAFMVINPQTKADKLAYVLADAGAVALVADGHLARTVAAAAADAPTLGTVLVRGGPAAADGAHADPAAADRPATAGGGAGDVAGGLARPAATRSAAWLDLDDALAAHDPDPGDGGALPIDLAALIYTSGSTGAPKGVMLSHQNMVFTQGSLVQYLRLSADDRILNVLPLAFDYGLYQALMAIHLGATLVLERSFAFPAHVVQRVVREGVTVFPGVPTVFATLLALHRRSPLSMPTVRRYTNTAAHLPDDYVPGLTEISPGALVYKMYGLTECKRVCYLEPELVAAKPRSVGKAIPGTETFVLDDDGNEVPPGVTGTLWVRGPHVMLGYWNLPAETGHMLKPGRYPGERMLCTHDLFRTDEDGFLYFVGRSDDIIKSRGEKVSPVEVENVLAGLPGVVEAAVVGVPDELLGQAVRAYVVLEPGAIADATAFRRACMARMESHMVPRDVIFVPELPKTGSGKVRKMSLIEAGAS